ncbi:MAG: hypothetical protein K6B41_06425 [Butyrivibrio sp.]|nr:hypothetical protein [Butyrivibrio sp.]
MEVKNNDNQSKITAVKEAIDSLDANSLNEMKIWLFKESCRLENQESVLDEREHLLAQQEKEFYEKHRQERLRLETDQKRLSHDVALFEQKLNILKEGYAGLEEDRKKINAEWDRLRREKKYIDEDRSSAGEMFFKGVTSLLSLKKRYKDLLKIYHPDNMGGDHEMVTMITAEYNNLIKQYDISKKA